MSGVALGGDFSTGRCQKRRPKYHRRLACVGVWLDDSKRNLGYRRRHPAKRLTALDCADTLWAVPENKKPRVTRREATRRSKRVTASGEKCGN